MQGMKREVGYYWDTELLIEIILNTVLQPLQGELNESIC